MTRYNQFVDEINGYEVYRATVAGRIAEENAENEEWFEAYDNVSGFVDFNSSKKLKVFHLPTFTFWRRLF